MEKQTIGSEKPLVHRPPERPRAAASRPRRPSRPSPPRVFPVRRPQERRLHLHQPEPPRVASDVLGDASSGAPEAVQHLDLWSFSSPNRDRTSGHLRSTVFDFSGLPSGCHAAPRPPPTGVRSEAAWRSPHPKTPRPFACNATSPLSAPRDAATSPLSAPRDAATSPPRRTSRPPPPRSLEATATIGASRAQLRHRRAQLRHRLPLKPERPDAAFGTFRGRPDAQEAPSGRPRRVLADVRLRWSSSEAFFAAHQNKRCPFGEGPKAAPRSEPQCITGSSEGS